MKDQHEHRDEIQEDDYHNNFDLSSNGSDQFIENLFCASSRANFARFSNAVFKSQLSSVMSKMPEGILEHMRED